MRPRLTFFCELEKAELVSLFASGKLLDDLKELGAGISLGLLDLSPERASVVRRLNQAGIPTIAWLLLPKEQGYWFNLDNAPQAVARYQAFRTWTAEEGLRWEGVGLDIEPDIRLMEALFRRQFAMIPRLSSRALRTMRLRQGKKIYWQLAEQIRADGYRLESYQFPLILDERLAHSSVLQRLTGIVDIPAEREVFMLYTSLLRPNGLGALWSYGPEIKAVALGITGGGVDLGGWNRPPLNWDELARDLCHAWRWSDTLYIFSLEGCLRQGFLEQLQNFDWDRPIMEPVTSLRRVDAWRATLQSSLWLVNNLAVIVLSGLAAALLLVPLWRYWRSTRR